MKINFIFITLLICILFPLISNAKQTDEVSIDQIFKESFNIANSEQIAKYGIFIKNTINIFKNKPESLEVNYLSYLIKDVVDYEKSLDTLLPDFKELYDQYYNSINNYDQDMPQKLVLAYMLLRGFNIEGDTDDVKLLEISEHGHEILKDIKDKCKNKSYAAIATLMLSCVFIKSGLDEEFITKFPNHPAIPFVEACAIDNKYYYKDNRKLIDELLLLKNKYPKVQSPLGYNLYIESYGSIVYAYFELGELDNAKKYINMIKSEAPDFWNLHNLEKLFNDVKSGKRSFDFK